MPIIMHMSTNSKHGSFLFKNDKNFLKGEQSYTCTELSLKRYG